MLTRPPLLALLVIASLLLMLGFLVLGEAPESRPKRQPIGTSALSHGGPPQKAQESPSSKSSLAAPDARQERESR